MEGGGERERVCKGNQEGKNKRVCVCRGGNAVLKKKKKKCPWVCVLVAVVCGLSEVQVEQALR